MPQGIALRAAAGPAQALAQAHAGQLRVALLLLLGADPGQLEQGRAGLEQSIALFAEGSELKRHCAAKLADAQMRIERLQIDADGQPRGSAPFVTDTP